MGQVVTIGLDIAKSVFQVHGVDAVGEVVIRRQVRRGQMLSFFATQPLCLVGIFDRSKGSKTSIENGLLVLSQDRGNRIQLSETGAMQLQLSLDGDTGDRGRGGMSVLQEEVVEDQLSKGLSYVLAVLERLDTTQRLATLAVAAQITGGEYLSWRSRREEARTRGSIQGGFGSDRPGVVVPRSRASLRLERATVVEDLLVPLRRQWKAT